MIFAVQAVEVDESRHERLARACADQLDRFMQAVTANVNANLPIGAPWRRAALQARRAARTGALRPGRPCHLAACSALGWLGCRVGSPPGPLPQQRLPLPACLLCMEHGLGSP